MVFHGLFLITSVAPVFYGLDDFNGAGKENGLLMEYYMYMFLILLCRINGCPKEKRSIIH